jgi:tetratricopeptide (TPR) repeat protein
LAGAVRRRPGTVAALLLVLLAGAAAGAAYRWALAEEQAARRALKDEEYFEARRHVENCLLVRRRSVEVRLLAARVAWMEGDFPRAETHLRESARLAGGNTEAIQRESVLLKARAGDVDLVAGGLWRLVDAHDPESAVILQALAKAYMAEVRLEAALRCLNKWLEIEPDAVTALDWRAWVLDRQGWSHDQAREEWERVVQLAPDRWRTRLQLAEVLMTDGGPGHVLPHLAYLRRTHPEQPEVLMLWGRFRAQQGDVDEAKRIFDRLLETDPDNGRLLLWRAQLELQPGGDAVAAEGWLRRALAREPADTDINYELYQCLRQQPDRDAEAAAQRRRYEQVRADVERLNTLVGVEYGKSPRDAGIPAEIGALMIRLGQEGRGLRWLNIALGLDPNCKPAHEALTAYYEAKGDAKKAEEHRRRTAG